MAKNAAEQECGPQQPDLSGPCGTPLSSRRSSPAPKLPEDTIGERFGASRTIVRTALTRLAGEGLVEMRRNRGAAVAKPTWEEARDVFDVRVGLERLVVARLARG